MKQSVDSMQKLATWINALGPRQREALANIGGHILPLCPIAPPGGEAGIEKTDIATADAV